MKRLGIGCAAVLGILVIIVIVISVASSANRPPTSTASTPVSGVAQATLEPGGSTPGAQGSIENPYPANAEVIVGDVRWAIKKVGSAATLAVPFGDPKKARGIYVVVSIEVENQGDKAQTLTGLDLSDARGRTFEGSTDMFTLEPKQIFFETLNPGLPLEFTTVFDVPKDATGLMARVSNLRSIGMNLAYVALGELPEWAP